MSFHRFLAIAVLALLGACATPPRHESQLAAGVDLTSYRRFALVGPGDTADAPLRLLDANIRDALRAEFLRRGYAESADSPELLVDYETSTADRVRSSPVRVGIGMGSYGSNMGGSVSMGSRSVQSYQEGRLIIHVVDAAKRAEVWSGTIAGRVDRTKLDAPAVARVVALAMQDFPAKAPAPAAP
jgi:hypothetical protein